MSRPRSRTLRRALACSVGLVLAAVLAAPFLRADRFRERIREALERALNRSVEVGRTRFNLLTGPGFSVDDVVIHEDPAIGYEPFAYVSSLEARLRLSSLWTGRLEFSNLRLVEPSVNLAKGAAGGWNLQPLVDRTVRAARPGGTALPAIQVRAGRLNFKLGDVKSVFYLANADVDIAPEPGAARIRFSGEPARTDRAAQGFGRLSGRGRWRTAAGGELELNVELERSAIAEVVTLIHGHDVGLHGLIAARARLAGPPNDLRVTGVLRVEDVHRWDLMPTKGEGWPLEYRGLIDLPGQRFELETVEPGGKRLPVSARLRAWRLLDGPEWAMTATLSELPAAPVLEVARHLGAAWPAELKLDGKLEGVLGYSERGGVQGKVALREASLEALGASGIRCPEAFLLVDGQRVRLAPATVRVGDTASAEIEADYGVADESLDLKLSSRKIGVADLPSGLARLLGSPPPLLEAVTDGRWRGWLRYQRKAAAAGEWTGSIELENARVTLPGFAEPLREASSAVRLNGGRIEMNRLAADIGKLKIKGDYRYLPQNARPHRFHLAVAEAEAAEVERLLAPALIRRQGFLARTLRLGRATLPGWLKARRAEGAVQIGKLGFGAIRLEAVRARLIWDAARVELNGIESVCRGAPLTGEASADLGAALPRYRFKGRLEDLAWKDGSVGLEGSIETAGAGADLLRNLRASLRLDGRSLAFDPDHEPASLAANCELAFRRGAPQLRLTAVQFSFDGDMYKGQGGAQADGQIQADLSSGRKELRLKGALWPPELEIAGPR